MTRLYPILFITILILTGFGLDYVHWRRELQKQQASVEAPGSYLQSLVQRLSPGAPPDAQPPAAAPPDPAEDAALAAAPKPASPPLPPTRVGQDSPAKPLAPIGHLTDKTCVMRAGERACPPAPPPAPPAAKPGG